MASFKAIVVTKTDSGTAAALTNFDDDQLMDGNVTLRPEWSSLNYKDGLAVTGKGPVVRRFPMIAGIDAAAVVESSTDPAWKGGDRVIPVRFKPGVEHCLDRRMRFQERRNRQCSGVLPRDPQFQRLHSA